MSIEKKIARLIKNNGFYQSIYKNTSEIVIDQLPIINKEMVISNYDSICTNKHSAISVSTSGTTGQPIVIRWSKSDYIFSNLYTWKLRKKWYDISPDDKFCTFHVDTVYGMAEMSILNDGRTLSLGKYNLSEDILDRYINAMKEFEPKWILGPVSLIFIIFNRMKEKNIIISSLRYIELNGEYVSEHIYKEIVSLCKVKVGNLYGATEFNGIAFMCPFGNMHVLEQNVYIENKHIGKISNFIITGLCNSIMPLIRYDIGDSGLVKENVKCLCGLHGKTLEISYGREAEVVKAKDNSIINASAFGALIYQLNIEKTVVLQYCVDIRETGYVLQLLVNKSAYCSVCNKKKWMKQQLQKFGIHFDIEIFIDMKDILDGRNKFTFIKKNED